MASISKLGKTYVSAAEITEFTVTKGITLTAAQCNFIADFLADKLQKNDNDRKIMAIVLKALAGA